jgi:hypothetical protein
MLFLFIDKFRFDCSWCERWLMLIFVSFGRITRANQYSPLMVAVCLAAADPKEAQIHPICLSPPEVPEVDLLAQLIVPMILKFTRGQKMVSTLTNRSLDVYMDVLACCGDYHGLKNYVNCPGQASHHYCIRCLIHKDDCFNAQIDDFVEQPRRTKETALAAIGRFEKATSVIDRQELRRDAGYTEDEVSCASNQQFV